MKDFNTHHELNWNSSFCGWKALDGEATWTSALQSFKNASNYVHEDTPQLPGKKGQGCILSLLLKEDVVLLQKPGVGEVARVGLCLAGEEGVLWDVHCNVLWWWDNEWGTCWKKTKQRWIWNLGCLDDETLNCIHVYRTCRVNTERVNVFYWLSESTMWRLARWISTVAYISKYQNTSTALGCDHVDNSNQ